MFDCKVCIELKEEVKHLREINKELTNQLIAMSNPYALTALQPAFPTNPEDYYGTSSADEFCENDNFGQRILVRKDPITKS